MSCNSLLYILGTSVGRLANNYTRINMILSYEDAGAADADLICTSNPRATYLSINKTTGLRPVSGG